MYAHGPINVFGSTQPVHENLTLSGWNSKFGEPSYEYGFYDKLELTDLRKLREVVNTVIYDKERK